jgi:hypothetical protein
VIARESGTSLCRIEGDSVGNKNPFAGSPETQEVWALGAEERLPPPAAAHVSIHNPKRFYPLFCAKLKCFKSVCRNLYCIRPIRTTSGRPA